MSKCIKCVPDTNNDEYSFFSFLKNSFKVLELCVLGYIIIYHSQDCIKTISLKRLNQRSTVKYFRTVGT